MNTAWIKFGCVLSALAAALLGSVYVRHYLLSGGDPCIRQKVEENLRRFFANAKPDK